METLQTIGLFAAIILAIALTFWSSWRSEAILRRWARGRGVRLLEAEYCRLWWGPFFWTSSRNQQVYRIAVEYPDGAVRYGWARVGGWVLGVLSDEVEVRWDEHKPLAPGFPVVMRDPPKE